MFELSPLRGAYFATFAVSFLLTEWGRKVYRPHVYANGIHDGGLADVIGNLGGTLAAIFLNLGTTHATRTQGTRTIGLVTVGMIVYEVIQGVLPNSIFDWKDVAATLLAGLMAVGMLAVIHRFWSERAVASGTESKE